MNSSAVNINDNASSDKDDMSLAGAILLVLQNPTFWLYVLSFIVCCCCCICTILCYRMRHVSSIHNQSIMELQKIFTNPKTSRLQQEIPSDPTLTYSHSLSINSRNHLNHLQNNHHHMLQHSGTTLEDSLTATPNGVSPMTTSHGFNGNTLPPVSQFQLPQQLHAHLNSMNQMSNNGRGTHFQASGVSSQSQTPVSHTPQTVMVVGPDGRVSRFMTGGNMNMNMNMTGNGNLSMNFGNGFNMNNNMNNNMNVNNFNNNGLGLQNTISIGGNIPSNMTYTSDFLSSFAIDDSNGNTLSSQYANSGNHKSGISPTSSEFNENGGIKLMKPNTSQGMQGLPPRKQLPLQMQFTSSTSTTEPFHNKMDPSNRTLNNRNMIMTNNKNKNQIKSNNNNINQDSKNNNNNSKNDGSAPQNSDHNVNNNNNNNIINNGTETRNSDSKSKNKITNTKTQLQSNPKSNSNSNTKSKESNSDEYASDMQENTPIPTQTRDLNNNINVMNDYNVSNNNKTMIPHAITSNNIHHHHVHKHKIVYSDEREQTINQKMAPAQSLNQQIPRQSSNLMTKFTPVSSTSNSNTNNTNSTNSTNSSLQQQGGNRLHNGKINRGQRTVLEELTTDHNSDTRKIHIEMTDASIDNNNNDSNNTSKDHMAVESPTLTASLTPNNNENNSPNGGRPVNVDLKKLPAKIPVLNQKNLDKLNSDTNNKEIKQKMAHDPSLSMLVGTMFFLDDLTQSSVKLSGIGQDSNGINVRNISISNPNGTTPGNGNGQNGQNGQHGQGVNLDGHERMKTGTTQTTQTYNNNSYRYLTGPRIDDQSVSDFSGLTGVTFGAIQAGSASSHPRTNTQTTRITNTTHSSTNTNTHSNTTDTNTNANTSTNISTKYDDTPNETLGTDTNLHILDEARTNDDISVTGKSNSPMPPSGIDGKTVNQTVNNHVGSGNETDNQKPLNFMDFFQNDNFSHDKIELNTNVKRKYNNRHGTSNHNRHLNNYNNNNTKALHSARLFSDTSLPSGILDTLMEDASDSGTGTVQTNAIAITQQKKQNETQLMSVQTVRTEEMETSRQTADTTSGRTGMVSGTSTTNDDGGGSLNSATSETNRKARGGAGSSGSGSGSSSEIITMESESTDIDVSNLAVANLDTTKASLNEINVNGNNRNGKNSNNNLTIKDRTLNGSKNNRNHNRNDGGDKRLDRENNHDEVSMLLNVNSVKTNKSNESNVTIISKQGIRNQEMIEVSKTNTDTDISNENDIMGSNTDDKQAKLEERAAMLRGLKDEYKVRLDFGGNWGSTEITVAPSTMTSIATTVLTDNQTNDSINNYNNYNMKNMDTIPENQSKDKDKDQDKETQYQSNLKQMGVRKQVGSGDTFLTSNGSETRLTPSKPSNLSDLSGHGINMNNINNGNNNNNIDNNNSNNNNMGHHGRKTISTELIAMSVETGDLTSTPSGNTTEIDTVDTKMYDYL